MAAPAVVSAKLHEERTFGEVMQESANIAQTCIKAHARELSVRRR